MKKWLKILLIVFIVIILGLVLLSAAGYFLFFKSSRNNINSTPGKSLQNPLQDIINKNTDANGKINQNAVIKQGVIEFNKNYINYILIALGVNNLHKTILGDTPKVEFILGDEIWSSEVTNNQLNTQNQPIVSPDITISMSKEEAVKAILSDNLDQFMKTSVINGNTKINMLSGKITLVEKGYVDMYNKIIAQ